MLKEKIAPETRELTLVPWWRASQAGACETLLWHTKMGHEPLELPKRVKHLFDDGHAHERDIVERWRSAGVEVLHSCFEGQLEVVALDEPRTIGHLDGILDVPKDFPRGLDFADESFRHDLRYYMLEVTAPNHFTFQRIKQDHLKVILWQKYVQIQLYLNSEEVKSYTDCCIATIKNKNTSELYEEGISVDPSVVVQVRESLIKLGGLLESKREPGYRCSDFRRQYCQFRHLCYGTEQPEATQFEGALVGEELKEANELLEAVEVWRKGKELEESGKEMIDDSRELFRTVLEEHGAQRLSVQNVVAQMIDQSKRSTDLFKLQKDFLEAYNACVTTNPSRYVRVS